MGRAHLRWVHEDDAHELRCTNRGIALARAPLIAAWQDDMFLQAAWFVPEVLAQFDAYPDLGMLALSRGSELPSAAPIRSSAGKISSIRRGCESTIGPAPWNWFRLQEVDAVIRPWIVRRACLDRVGMLDEAFRPTEWDESDLAFRIREAGWRVATFGYERLGAYLHLGSTTIGTPSDEVQGGRAAQRPALSRALGRDDRAHARARAPDVAAQGDAGGLDRDRQRDGAPRALARAGGRAMSRTARASIAAAFSYVHVGVTLIAGLWLVPFMLDTSARRSYGLWLASGELLAYAGLAELGMLVTLPWLIAQADGQGDRARLRQLVSTGAAAAAISAVGYVATGDPPLDSFRACCTCRRPSARACRGRC